MHNNINYFRVYDEKLDLLYEAVVDKPETAPNQLNNLLRKSVLFLNVGNISCYRIVPQLK